MKFNEIPQTEAKSVLGKEIKYTKKSSVSISPSG